MPEETKPMTSVQLIRDVLMCGPDGGFVKITESTTAQIRWDTPDGNSPPKSSSYSIYGEWRMVE